LCPSSISDLARRVLGDGPSAFILFTFEFIFSARNSR
jgi:hypothetical protein